MTLIAGKTVIVTGAAQGIGAATASAFVSRGYAVAVVDLNEELGAKTVARLEESGGSAQLYVCDLTSSAEVEKLADRIRSDSQSEIVALVNNAGWTVNQPFMEQAPELWCRLIGSNLLSVLNMCRYVTPILADRGAIVNVASDAGRVGVGRLAVYAAAKAGVVGFSKSLALELTSRAIRVNVVSPGTTLTPLVRETLSDAQVERRQSINPLGRLAEPSDIAAAIVSLALDLSYVNGQVLSVNGGSARVG
jgi:NAD(P)-dependent dehydrogenase (short-subunit alcohol dehydrogenase family)